MAITAEERRFLRSWEEQRKGGKKVYVAIYTFGLTLVIFLSSIALGLFLNIPFIQLYWLAFIGIASIGGAFGLSILMWNQHQKKFRKIINREMAQSN
jgi:hypothetical protein